MDAGYVFLSGIVCIVFGIACTAYYLCDAKDETEYVEHCSKIKKHSLLLYSLAGVVLGAVLLYVFNLTTNSPNVTTSVDTKKLVTVDRRYVDYVGEHGAMQLYYMDGDSIKEYQPAMGLVAVHNTEGPAYCIITTDTHKWYFLYHEDTHIDIYLPN